LLLQTAEAHPDGRAHVAAPRAWPRVAAVAGSLTSSVFSFAKEA
jgi:hypothetical protein